MSIPCDCGCYNPYTGEPYPWLSRPSANIVTQMPLSKLVKCYDNNEHLNHDIGRARELYGLTRVDMACV